MDADNEITKNQTGIAHRAEPEYWDAGCTHISAHDPVLAPIIAKHRKDVLVSHGDLFRTLANAIVGQQISVVAAAAIWNRLTDRYPDLSPRDLAAAAGESLGELGLSRQKVDYLQGIGRTFSQPDFDLAAWARGSSEEVFSRLVALRGVGPWTAQMVLIFSQLRQDVLPLGDVGLLNCAADVYRWGRDKTMKELQSLVEQQAENWKPYRTIGVWYLWRELDAEPVLY